MIQSRIKEKSVKNPNPDLDNSAEEYLKDSESFKNLIEKIKWIFYDFVFQNTVNAFLVPKRKASKLQENFRIAGKAELSLMQGYAFKAKLPSIQIVELEPDFVYENYLSGAKITKELD